MNSFAKRFNKWWKDLSIFTKLYVVVGVMAILIAMELFTLMFTINVLSAVRGFVGGEGLWSKSQKNAVIEIQNYIVFKDEKYYRAFKKNLEVPLGDRQARQAMEQKVLDWDRAFEGFLRGKNHEEDIPSMIRLIRRFYWVSHLRKSIQAWQDAETLLDELIVLGERIHVIIQSKEQDLSTRELKSLLNQLSHVNEQLTVLEDRFSYSLGEASRWLEGTLLLIVLSLVLIVECTGLFLTFRFSKSLSKTLKEINDAAHKVGKGDFSVKLPVHSHDELGQLAESLNRMTADLQSMAGEKTQAEEANQVKSLFLANMSHEIRTPLGAILGFIELLKDGNISEKERQQYLDIISRTGEALVTIINDILDISKVEAGKIEIDKETFSLAQLVRDLNLLLKLRSDDKGIRLEFRPHGYVPEMINTDPMRLRQILLNVVGNAIKFTTVGSVVVSYWVDGRTLIFSVRDTGPGIPPDQISKLFKPFSQVDLSIRKFHGGTGLGLILSRKLAELLGGDVILQSTDRLIGSTFVVRVQIEVPDVQPGQKLDEATKVPEATADSDIGRAERLNGKNILLVEDVLDNQVLVSHFLSRTGAKVKLADNGREGVLMALSEDFDLILMDMQMPVLDGYSATKELRESGFEKPIIALTAHAMKEDLRKCIQVGCNDVLTKPIKRVDLIQIVAKYCS